MGGILGALSSIGVFCRKMFSTKAFDKDVIENVFAKKSKDSPNREEDRENHSKVAEQIVNRLGSGRMVRLGDLTAIYSCLVCSRKRKRNRKEFERMRKAVVEEMDVVKYIKNMRLLHSMVFVLFNDAQRKILQAGQVLPLVKETANSH